MVIKFYCENYMDILCAHHAKDPETCKWVIANTDVNTDNLTVIAWVQACKDYLASLDEGVKTA